MEQIIKGFFIGLFLGIISYVFITQLIDEHKSSVCSIKTHHDIDSMIRNATYQNTITAQKEAYILDEITNCK